MKTKAFTLIELLVVISIIAILAAIALPAQRLAVIYAQQARSLAHARQIGLALRMFANDNDGRFPAVRNGAGEDIVTSNDAFRDLVPAYVDDEKVFAVGRSKDGPAADNKVEPASEILRPGENHFAYIEGLDSGSRSTYPLIVDGTDGQGMYVADESKPGGVWNGDKAIVVSVGNSAELVKLRGPSTARYIPRYNDPAENALNVTAYLGTNARLLDPASP